MQDKRRRVSQPGQDGCPRGSTPGGGGPRLVRETTVFQKVPVGRDMAAMNGGGAALGFPTLLLAFEVHRAQMGSEPGKRAGVLPEKGVAARSQKGAA